MNPPRTDATEPTVGVLLTALGGPNDLEEVAPFLVEVRGGRTTPLALVEEFRGRYARIGGRSPLLEISTAQATALEERLAQGPGRYRCYVGMRHWKPFIRDVLGDMHRDGLSSAVVLPLTPYHSRRTVGLYLGAVEEARRAVGATFPILGVESWNTEPSLLSAYARATTDGIARLSAAGFPDPRVLFTAHSLPRQLIESGDDYEKELRETMDLVLRRLGPVRAQLAFQSAGRSNEPWLGPSLETTMQQLADAGERSVLVVPLGFISDHLETLYDIDVEARQLAADLGLRFERAASLNTDPELIEAMAHAVRARRSG